MESACFTSTLTEEQIINNFKDIDFFSGIMSGLEDALAYEKGDAKAATFVRKRSLPDINNRLLSVADAANTAGMSEADFISRMNESTASA